MVSKIEDTIVERFKGHHQLPYAHWLKFLILRAKATKSLPATSTGVETQMETEIG
jgi:hypothetical protein